MNCLRKCVLTQSHIRRRTCATRHSSPRTGMAPILNCDQPATESPGRKESNNPHLVRSPGSGARRRRVTTLRAQERGSANGGCAVTVAKIAAALCCGPVCGLATSVTARTQLRLQIDSLCPEMPLARTLATTHDTRGTYARIGDAEL